MKPIYLSLHRQGHEVAVNMNQVCWMYPNVRDDPSSGTVLMFNFTINDEAAWVHVDETMAQISSHPGWSR